MACSTPMPSSLRSLSYSLMKAPEFMSPRSICRASSSVQGAGVFSTVLLWGLYQCIPQVPPFPFPPKPDASLEGRRTVWNICPITQEEITGSLFTQVRGIEILGSSQARSSPKFNLRECTYWAVGLIPNQQTFDSNLALCLGAERIGFLWREEYALVGVV
jgi:hypothetical protein